jgi:hypothetical protein
MRALSFTFIALTSLLRIRSVLTPTPFKRTAPDRADVQDEADEEVFVLAAGVTSLHRQEDDRARRGCDMRQLNLSMEGLIAVVTVAQEGSLERAGKVLSLGRSAVGKHVGIAEAEVGAPLFDRHGGRWVLNEEGRLFAPKASQSILYARISLDLVQSHVKLIAVQNSLIALAA